MQTVLIQNVDFYNPYSLETKNGFIEVENIIFLQDGKPLIQNKVRWFGSSNNEYPKIVFDFETRKANKVNYNSANAFYTTQKNKATVYIPVSLLTEFQFDGDLLDFETETERKYLPTYSFKASASFKQYIINENGSYDYIASELKPLTIKFNDYYKTELTEAGERIDTIYKVLQSNNINISLYDLKQLAKIADIKLK